MYSFSVYMYCMCERIRIQGRLGTVDFHTLEEWTFDIIHCYFRFPDDWLGIAGWEKIKIASALHNVTVSHAICSKY